MKKTISFLVVFMALMSIAYARNRKVLVVELLGGQTDTIALTNVDSIYFSEDGANMILAAGQKTRTLSTADYQRMEIMNVEEGPIGNQTILEYLASQEEYTEFVSLLRKAPAPNGGMGTVADMLDAEGAYTCFAPTNQAIQSFLENLVKEGKITSPKWESFSREAVRDSLQRTIVYSSIIEGGFYDMVYYSKWFPAVGQEFLLPNMNGQKLYVATDWETGGITVSQAPLVVANYDIPSTNGVVHGISTVIPWREYTAKEYFQDILDSWWYDKNTEAAGGQLVTARLLQACGLLDTLSAWRDEEYENMYQCGIIPNDRVYPGFGSSSYYGYAPQHRYIGFTIFGETDEFWKAQGIDPTAVDLLPKLVKWIESNGHACSLGSYITDTNYADPQHILYQWITYHMLPMRIRPDRLVYHGYELGYNTANPDVLTIPVCEYYTTMGQRRLLKIYESAESGGVRLNRFPCLDNGRRGTGHELYCGLGNEGVLVDKNTLGMDDMRNCVVYPIHSPLSYSSATRDNLNCERLRFDVMSLFPESMTNDIRRNDSMSSQSMYVYLPTNSMYQYFNNLWVGDNTFMFYLTGTGQVWQNMLGDEMSAVDYYDVTLKLPPVPADGIYELRYGVQIYSPYRGILQEYVGSDIEALNPVALPFDYYSISYNPNVSRRTSFWVEDMDDEDYNAINDKVMRLHGFMKAPNSFAYNGRNLLPMRNTDISMRRIVTQMAMKAGETYYLRLRSVQDALKVLYLDYLELCPESVYDSPVAPEDIW